MAEDAVSVSRAELETGIVTVEVAGETVTRPATVEFDATSPPVMVTVPV